LGFGPGGLGGLGVGGAGGLGLGAGLWVRHFSHFHAHFGI
jgi:hypothetical protein